MSKAREILLDDIDDVLDEVLETGHALRQGFFKSAVSSAVESEARSFRTMLPDQELRGNGSRRTIYLKPKTVYEAALLSARRTPVLKGLSVSFENATQRHGRRRGIQALAGWVANKAVINHIPGTHVEHGVIKPHFDPERFSGVLFIMSCADADITINDENPVKVGPGELEVFIGADLANDLRVRQPEHSIDTAEDRYSVVMAHDTAPSLGTVAVLKSVAQARMA